MNFKYFICFTLFVIVIGKGTQSSESKSSSSSSTSSSDELGERDQPEGNKVGNNEKGGVVKDGETGTSSNMTETEKINELENFDEALEKDGIDQGYEKRDKSNSTIIPKPSHRAIDDHKGQDEVEKLMDSGEMNKMDNFERNMTASEEDMDKDMRNETVLGIDTFGAQGI